jgi:peptide/nickel transport system permease protein
VLAYTVKRIGLAVVITALALIMLISTIQLIPGDPAAVLLGPLATPELRASFPPGDGASTSRAVQIGRFFARVVTGDLGTDVLTQRPGSASPSPSRCRSRSP